MLDSDAADRAAFRSSPNEVRMALLSEIERAPESDFAEIHIRRDGEPDLVLGHGRLLLTAKTTPRGSSPSHPNKRWKVYRLYATKPASAVDRTGRRDPYGRLVVTEEGHSSLEGETIRHSARICSSPIEAWEVMGKIDELKDWFAELGLPVVMRI